LITRKKAKELGLKQYYTGIHCVRGHLAPRCTFDGTCTKCKKLKKRSVRNKDPEKAKEKDRIQARRYRLKNRLSVNAIARKSYIKNKDRRLENGRAYIKNNIAKVMAYREKNRERNKERSRAYAKAHPEKRSAQQSAREARKLKATPSWSDMTLISDMYAEAIYHQLQVDHIVPLRSKHVCGLHVEHNLQLLPPKENSSKGNRFWPDMWV